MSESESQSTMNVGLGELHVVSDPGSQSSAVQSGPPEALRSLDPVQTLSRGAFLLGLSQLTSYNLSTTTLQGLQTTLAWQSTWLIYLRGPL